MGAVDSDGGRCSQRKTFELMSKDLKRASNGV